MKVLGPFKRFFCYIRAKTFRTRKNFLGSNVTLLPRFFCLCIFGVHKYAPKFGKSIWALEGFGQSLFASGNYFYKKDLDGPFHTNVFFLDWVGSDSAELVMMK